jgi:hypothetical protein
MSIEFYPDCPHCQRHVPYYCETAEKIKSCRWMKPWIARDKATIERCAQAAEEYVEKYHHNGKRAGDFIRKLKDTP